MDEMIDPKTARLAHRAEQGSVMRSFGQHPGFKVYREALEDIVNDKKKKWLQGSDDEARIFRYQAQGVEMALGVLKRIVLDGDLAVSQLRENAENSLEPQDQPGQAQ